MTPADIDSSSPPQVETGDYQGQIGSVTGNDRCTVCDCPASSGTRVKATNR